MMLMPTGPPAMILVALCDVTGAAESIKMTVAKFLTVSDITITDPMREPHLTNLKISYAVTPMICFAVVSALEATKAAIKS